MTNEPLTTRTARQQQLEDRFRTVRTGPDLPRQLRFELTIPRSWKPSKHDKQRARGFHPLFRFAPAEGTDADVVVAVGRSSRDVNPADCLAITWEKAGGRILDRRDAMTPGGTESSILVRHAQHGRRDMLCSRVVKDGNRLFRVDARAAEDLYRRLAEDLPIPPATFRLLDPEGIPTAESQIEASYDAPMPFCFKRPSSWHLREIANERNRLSIQLEGRAAKPPIDRITIEVRTRRDGLGIGHLARDYAESLRARGIRVGGAALLAAKPPMGFQAAAVFAPAVHLGEQALFSHVLMLDHPQGLMSLGLLGPTRKACAERWAINTRAFEIVRDSIRRIEGMERN